jgi:hypothetical protein
VAVLDGDYLRHEHRAHDDGDLSELIANVGNQALRGDSRYQTTLVVV